ncbi:copper resistance CopC/CopD family protein [Catellatospora vulcania]|uniref:copper resistance CopC/CopD family protein n=1 Tax=Catellatospora vulcania TaxID=1460450 RepID=UPI0018AFB7FB|nr:FixH family protein [Catellatospora vulcania]
MSSTVTVTRRAGSAVLALLAGLLGVLAAASPAYAHATLLGTDPVDGAVLPKAPAQVTLTFNEPVAVRPGAVRLLDAQGTQVSAEARSVDTTVVLTVPPAAADGTYLVSYRVISADDHPISGGFSFSVGAPSTTGVTVTAPEPDAAVQLLRRVSQGLLYLGVLLATGLLVFDVFLLTGASVTLRRRLWRTAAGAAGVVAVAAVLSIPVTTAWQDVAPPGALLRAATWSAGLSSDTALSSLLIVIGLAVALAAAGQVTSPAAAPGTEPPRRVVAATTSGLCPQPRSCGRRETYRLERAGRSALTAAGAALALGSLALVGHTRTFGPAWLVLAADLLHVATAAVWLGGLTGLVLTLARAAAIPAAAAGRTVAAFSRLAALLLAVLAAAGTVLAWRILGSWAALTGTAYGRSLLVKIGIAAVVVAVAAYNRWRLVPRLGVDTDGRARRRLSATVRAEALLLSAAVAVTGVLVTQSPVPAPAAAQAAPAGPRVVEAALGTGRAVARLTPGGIGVNSLELTLLAADGSPLQPIEEPELTLTLPAADIGPLDRPLSRTGPGRYEAVVDLPLAGAWQLTVSARTGKYDNPSARLTVEIR